MDRRRGAVVAGGIASAVGVAPRRGTALAAAERIGPVAVAWRDGVVDFVGDPDDLPGEVGKPAGTPDRGLLVPGFVDCHVHLPFVGWRADEFEARLAGTSYAELHGGDAWVEDRPGGGASFRVRLPGALTGDVATATAPPGRGAGR